MLDQEKKAVVVVIASGQLRFSYKGDPKSEFSPGGLCTDILSHTLVCDKMNSAVQLLDEDGRFLSLLLIQQGMSFYLSVYIDWKNNFYVGQLFKNVVSVYRYL